MAGLLLPALLPLYRVANLHFTFLGGFMVIIFTVSARVILGHAGQRQLLRGRLRFLTASLSLLIIATFTRVSADFVLPERNSHLVYAALIWLLAVAVWAWALLPKLAVAGEE